MSGPVLVGVALDDRDSGVVALGRTLARLLGAPLALVAFDNSVESRVALDAAIELACVSGAQLSTFTVSEPIETAPATVVPGWTVPAAYSAMHRERAEQIVESARERVPDELLAGARLLIGHAGDALAAASHDVDLLVCGSRGYGPLRAVMLGGVSSELAHSCACPLLIVPRGSTVEFAPEFAIAAASEDAGS